MWRALTVGLLALATLSLAGCGQDSVSAVPERPDRAARVHLVEAARAELAALAESSTYTGTLRARRSVRIFNQEPGQILQLPFFEGDAVAQGTTLVRLDDRLLRAQLDKAQATRRQSEVNLQRLQGLVKRQLVSEDELVRAQTDLELAHADVQLLEARLSYTRIDAPFDGVVSARLVEPGDAVSSHTHLMTLIDPQSLTVELQVPETLLPHLRHGDAASVRIDALGRQILEGEINRLHASVDASGRGTVEVRLTDAPAQVRAGQFARVTLAGRAPQRLVVPFAAVQRDPRGEYVYVLDEEQHVWRVGVRTGVRLGDRVEVLDGLEVGQPVVTKGFLGLHDGRSVRVVGERA
ncbi:efflux RND transporter periplasmic adaptor subunit [Ectothiorhodospiraceae bacterium 2226]|nr:efflux RND transporter periplasmic adaptor subunit [Ectothiorhodospiraceae bacterium 2226]